MPLFCVVLAIAFSIYKHSQQICSSEGGDSAAPDAADCEVSKGHYCPVISPTTSAGYDLLDHSPRTVSSQVADLEVLSQRRSHLKLVKCCVNFAAVAVRSSRSPPARRRTPRSKPEF